MGSLSKSDKKVAWLSLDAGDNDPVLFLTYLILALQTLALRKVEGISAIIGTEALISLQSPQPSPTESILTALLNDIATLPDNFTLILDDYHLIDSKPVDNVLTYLLEYLPPQMHLVITTREDPHLPLARLTSTGSTYRAAGCRSSFYPHRNSRISQPGNGIELYQQKTSPHWKLAPKAGLPDCN